MSCLAGLSMALLKRLSNSHSLSGFDPDSAQKPHWTSLSLGLSSESTSPNLLWSASLPSPTAVMHHPSNPQWNAQALKHPLSLVPFCFHLCFIYKDYLFIFIRTCQTYDYGYQSFVWQLTIAKCPLGNTLTKGYSSHRGYAQKWSVWRRSGVPRHWLDTNGGKRKTTALCSAEQWNRWAASDFLSQSFL